MLLTFFPMVVGLLDGFAGVPAEATELLRSYGASDRQAIRLLRWPAALPSFFTGLRIATTYAMLGAVYAEYVGSYDGLGIWILTSQKAFRIDLVFGAVGIVLRRVGRPVRGGRHPRARRHPVGRRGAPEPGRGHHRSGMMQRRAGFGRET